MTALKEAARNEAIQILVENNAEMPVFLSGNIDGADEHNQTMIQKYGKRIPLFTLGQEKRMVSIWDTN